ncbi:MAG: helix-turn-helix transcriptional regulator [Paracoccaceae bacterium]
MDKELTILDFGKRLRQLRTAQGLSQEGFALQVDLDRTYVGGIERGERNPGLKVILRISRALDLPVDQLFQKPEP